MNSLLGSIADKSEGSFNHVERLHKTAKLALVRGPEGRTRWIPYSPPNETPQDASSSMPIELQPKTTPSTGGGRLDLDASCFPNTPHFSLMQTSLAQNVLIFMHGRGDSHESFARLGEQMALPQTAVISLRAPGELPFGLGYTWTRSQSLQTARDYVWSFLRVLHDQYAWEYSRLFLFAFSQGACVAFHLAMSLPRDVRLGGMVLIAGGAIAGLHSSSSTSEKDAVATPMLQVTGAVDTVYPVALAERSRLDFEQRHSRKAALESFTSFVRPSKGHAMIDSRKDMQQVMLFFSKYLYLRNMSLENRSDVIELST